MRPPKEFSFHLEDGDTAAFLGLMGGGKSGCMTLLALRQILAIGGPARELRSNYPMRYGQHIHYLDELDAHGVAFCLDELQELAGSRARNSAFNRSLSSWIELRVRKRGNVLLFTAQHLDLIDINVRRLLGYIFHCQREMHRGQKFTRCRVFKRHGDEFFFQSQFVIPQKLFHGFYDHRWGSEPGQLLLTARPGAVSSVVSDEPSGSSSRSPIPPRASMSARGDGDGKSAGGSDRLSVSPGVGDIDRLLGKKRS